MTDTLNLTDLEKEILGPPAVKPPKAKPVPAAPPESVVEAPAPPAPAPVEEDIGFCYMNPNDLYIHGLDKLPEGFDPAVLEAFADPDRIHYDINENLEEGIKQAKRVRKAIECAVVKSLDGTSQLFPVKDGRQRLRIARKLGLESVPVYADNENNLNDIALWVVEANENRVHDSILVKVAKAKALSLRKPKINQRRIGTAFNENQSTISNWLKLADASPLLKSYIQNYEEDNGKPGIAWTTAVKMVKWSDEKIRETVEPTPEVPEGGSGGDGGIEDEGEATPPKSAKVTAASIFGNWKETLLAVVDDKNFKLPEEMTDPTECFVLGVTFALSKSVDDLPLEFGKTLNKKMAAKAKNLAKKANVEE